MRIQSIFLCCAAVFLLSQAGALAQGNRPKVQGNNFMMVMQDVKHDVSPPLYTLSNTATAAPSAPREIPRLRPVLPLRGGAAAPAKSRVDPALQGSVVGPAVPTTGILNFQGMSVNAGNSGFVAPPDPNGAVGLTQYVQWVNLAYAVYSKSTGALVLGPLRGNTIWSGFGGDCESLNDGDPVVNYDRIANRWVLSQFALNANAGQFSQCMAVSTTADATGTYNRYQFLFTDFIDYPKNAVWPDAYYITYNVFDTSGNTFLGPRVCAMNRAAMLAGNPATQVCFNPSASYYSLLAADMDGSVQPPAGTPEVVMAQDALFLSANYLNLWRFHVDFVTPANSTFTGPTQVTVPSYTEVCVSNGDCVPQPGTPNKLDSLNFHLMHRLQWRMAGGRESIVAVHTVDNGSGVAAERWYEIRNPTTTPTVFQAGTFSPDSIWRWMGSIAMDKMGNIALGYSVSDATSVLPGIRYTGRFRSDLRNQMQAENIIQNGLGNQTPNLHRWGDYSAMQVDPVDDCTFWYTNQYQPTDGNFNWTTRIASFKFPNCQ